MRPINIITITFTIITLLFIFITTNEQFIPYINPMYPYYYRHRWFNLPARLWRGWNYRIRWSKKLL